MHNYEKLWLAIVQTQCARFHHYIMVEIVSECLLIARSDEQERTNGKGDTLKIYNEAWAALKFLVQEPRETLNEGPRRWIKRHIEEIENT